MQVEFFDHLCRSTLGFIQAAYKAKGQNDTESEKVQLEEAFVDFSEAGEIRTFQQASTTIRNLAFEEGNTELVSYVNERIIGLYSKFSRGEQPSLPPLTGENGMWSFKVDPIKEIQN